MTLWSGKWEWEVGGGWRNVVYLLLFLQRTIYKISIARSQNKSSIFLKVKNDNYFNIIFQH